MAGKITLNDGTELQGSAVMDGDILWVDLNGSRFAGACELLLDRAKTERISVDQYNVVNVYTGFTHLFYLREEAGNKVSAGLEKAVSA